jgi:hypothetical protein
MVCYAFKFELKACPQNGSTNIGASS